MIGQDEDRPSEDRAKIRPKDMIGRDEDGPSDDFPKLRPKDMIGRPHDCNTFPKDKVGTYRAVSILKYSNAYEWYVATTTFEVVSQTVLPKL